MPSNRAAAPTPDSQSRAAIHLSKMPVGEALIACARRAKALGCRVVAMTLDEDGAQDCTTGVIDRLARDEFDVVIVRAGVNVSIDAISVAPENAR